MFDAGVYHSINDNIAGVAEITEGPMDKKKMNEMTESKEEFEEKKSFLFDNDVTIELQ